MSIPEDSETRSRLWIALGNQPGVSAWFAVWSLSREAKPPVNDAVKRTLSEADESTKCSDGSPA